MGHKPLLRAQIILVITAIIAAACVYLIVYGMTHSAMLSDMRDRSNGVRSYMESTMLIDYFTQIALGSEQREAAIVAVQNQLDGVKDAAGLRHLFLAWMAEGGYFVTSLYASDGDGGTVMYVPPMELYAYLRESFFTGLATSTERIYNTASGPIYAVYWPVIAPDGSVVFAVGMEFDAQSIHRSFRTMTIYSLALSMVLVIIISTIANISLSKISEPFYKKLAYIDFLTNCENRLAFEHRLRYCEDRIARLGTAVTILVFDVNDLKTLNDTQGHKVGDAYLIATANILKEHLDGVGPLFRVGGDEFASIILGKSEEEINEKVTNLKNEKRMTVKGRQFSCPVGVATFSKEFDENLRDTFARADENMYKEKVADKEKRGGL